MAWQSTAAAAAGSGSEQWEKTPASYCRYIYWAELPLERAYMDGSLPHIGTRHSSLSAAAVSVRTAGYHMGRVDAHDTEAGLGRLLLTGGSTMVGLK